MKGGEGEKRSGGRNSYAEEREPPTAVCVRCQEQCRLAGRMHRWEGEEAEEERETSSEDPVQWTKKPRFHQEARGGPQMVSIGRRKWSL